MEGLERSTGASYPWWHVFARRLFTRCRILKHVCAFSRQVSNLTKKTRNASRDLIILAYRERSSRYWKWWPLCAFLQEGEGRAHNGNCMPTQRTSSANQKRDS